MQDSMRNYCKDRDSNNKLLKDQYKREGQAPIKTNSIHLTSESSNKDKVDKIFSADYDDMHV